MVNDLHVLLDLPNLLESLPAEFAGQLFLVDFPLFLFVHVFDVRCYVVGVQEAFSTDFACIISLAGVRFPVGRDKSVGYPGSCRGISLTCAVRASVLCVFGSRRLCKRRPFLLCERTCAC
jgi:hypothetical protein